MKPIAIPRAWAPTRRPSSPPTPEVCLLPNQPAEAPAVPLSQWVRETFDFHPDPFQQKLLDCPDPRVIVATSRQIGKSTLAALRALHTAIHQPGSLILLVCPVSNQAGEILSKARAFAARLYPHVASDGHNRLSLRLPNGSRIVARPGVADSLRSYSAVRLLILDEAALLPDEAFSVVTPVLAASGGDLWLLSTPKGQTGRFSDIWHDGGDAWTRFSLTAEDCPRFSPGFLAAERRLQGERLFNQEYLCQFLGSTDHLLTRDQIAAAVVDTAHVAVNGLDEQTELYIGLDPGKRRDHTAIIVVKLTWTNGEQDRATMRFKRIPRITVHAADRLPLDTPTLTIPGRIRTLLQAHNAAYNMPKYKSAVMIDATGNGHTLVELIRAELTGRVPIKPAPWVRPVILTGGQFGSSLKDGYESVPRTELYENLKLLFENTALEIPRNIKGFDVLERELLRCHVDGEQREHDDLVMALAMTAWHATEQHRDLLGLPARPPLFPKHRMI